MEWRTECFGGMRKIKKKKKKHNNEISNCSFSFILLFGLKMDVYEV